MILFKNIKIVYQILKNNLLINMYKTCIIYIYVFIYMVYNINIYKN